MDERDLLPTEARPGPGVDHARAPPRERARARRPRRPPRRRRGASPARAWRGSGRPACPRRAARRARRARRRPAGTRPRRPAPPSGRGARPRAPKSRWYVSSASSRSSTASATWWTRAHLHARDPTRARRRGLESVRQLDDARPTARRRRRTPARCPPSSSSSSARTSVSFSSSWPASRSSVLRCFERSRTASEYAWSVRRACSSSRTRFVCSESA